MEYEPSDALVWDKSGNGVWSAIDGNPAYSRWLDTEGGSTNRYPDSGLTWAVVDVDTVVIAAPRQVDRLDVIGGGVAMTDGVELEAAGFAKVYDGAVMTLGNHATFSGTLVVHGTLASGTGVGTMNVAGSLTIEDGAEFACDVGQTDGFGRSDSLSVTEGLTLNGDNALTLRFSGDAPFKSGGYTLVTAGEIVGKFDSVSGLGDYVDMGDILQLPESVFLTINADLNAGDANLDKDTDVSDFNIWNAYKFTSGTDWGTGDFNGDGMTDVRDFNLWNGAKFTRAGWKGQAGGQVPEPAVLVLLIGGLLGIGGRSLAQRFSLSSPSSEKEQSP